MSRFLGNDARRARMVCALSAGLLVVLLLLSGCMPRIGLLSDYDPVTDFSSFRSFNFVPLAGARQPGSTRVTQQARRAITRELQNRGYVLEPHYPDLLVNFSNNVASKTVETPEGNDYYDYRYYSAWRGYPTSDEINPVRYPRGTLSVDLIDASRMQLVWEGTAVAELPGRESEGDGDAVSQAVAHIFTRYPFHAEPSALPEGLRNRQASTADGGDDAAEHR